MSKFFKEAGVGWDIQAYSVSPEKLDNTRAALQKAEKAYDKKLKATIGKMPSRTKTVVKKKFFGLIKNKTKKFMDYDEYTNSPKYQAYHKKWKAYTKKNPMPENDWEFRRRHRLHSDHKKYPTNYKLNMNIDAGFSSKYSGKLTDEVYSDTPKRYNLSKAELREALKEYKANAKHYKKSYPKDPYIDPGVKAFSAKAKAILKDPRAKTIRFEYE